MIINFDKRGGGGSDPALRTSAYTGVEYISSANTIDFYNIDGDVIGSIDTTDFVVDGMIENVSLSGNILTIIFNTDAGKQNINIDLGILIDPVNGSISGLTSRINDFERVTSIALNELRTDVSAINLADAVASAKTYTDGAISGLTEIIEEDEETTSRALNDLENKKVESLDIRNIVKISQSDYDAMSAHSSTTLYVID